MQLLWLVASAHRIALVEAAAHLEQLLALDDNCCVPSPFDTSLSLLRSEVVGAIMCRAGAPFFSALVLLACDCEGIPRTLSAFGILLSGAAERGSRCPDPKMLSSSYRFAALAAAQLSW